MTDPKKLADEIAVCAFVPPEELAELATRFRTIINNRPDSEEPGQPSSAEIGAEARRLGLDYVHIPIVQGQIGDEQVAAFGKAVSNRRGPVLAFCKTGRRAAMLWALSQAGQRSADEILTAAAAAGYDLSALKPKLEERAAAA
jgi:sulfide:quinone oxidoreductase